ncbi:hypothetical protein IQ259_09995 [Fortiea sp. LEGE XX443]|uniref:hypothetical protein n=1 Tax=Fortiea sp. LEGE XX443 TaxID=1828611 RepID=UPI001882B706|nr:hypothetical protein [Fortiea sp. LEGE XX443]MBE9005367.1 hypothetical protein [Fortiea sp. LEGE XX443]
MKATLAISLLSALPLSFFINSGKVLADNAQCRNANLRGTYAFEVSGFFGDQAPFSPAAAVRIVRFDGQGNFNGRGFSVLAGGVAEGNILGTYQVQSDCTVQITFSLLNLNGTQSVNNVFGVILDRGQKIRGVNTSSTVGPGTLFENFERIAD